MRALIDCLFFFFQAEDGIRDLTVTGVQTCALPISNTAAAMALVTWACLDLVRTGKITAVGAATGLVVGLVGITPPAGYITAPASLAGGAPAGSEEHQAGLQPQSNLLCRPLP